MATDIHKRLTDHNLGKVISSKQFRPYEILYVKRCTGKKDAARLEKFYKTTTGRRKIEELIERRGV